MPIPVHLRDYLIEWPYQKTDDHKSYFETTHRVISPEKTYKWISPLRKAAGITRVTEITDLDSIGIPTFTAVRPAVDGYLENVTVYNGKGLTQIQAKVSALMEAFERYTAERRDRPAILESYAEMSRYGKAVDPNSLILPAGTEYNTRESLEWICGRDLVSGDVYYVPAAAVFFPYYDKSGLEFIKAFPNTNGLASGNTIHEAISQGLAEVIERDAEAIAVTQQTGHSVDLSTVESRLIQSLIKKCQRANINLYVKDITSEFNIPSFLASMDDPVTENPMLLCRGIGTHVNAEIALMRSITEVAQSRLTLISGAREDLIEVEFAKAMETLGYYGMKKKMKYWFEYDKSQKDFNEISTSMNDHVSADINAILEALKSNGFGKVIVVNLTDAELNIPVVRVIVPGLEPSFETRRRGRRAQKQVNVPLRGLRTTFNKYFSR